MKKKSARRIRNVLLIFIAVLVSMLAGGYILAQVYKKEILAAVNESINEKITGVIQIDDIHFTIFSHFPSFSLTLENPSVRDSMYAAHHYELFRAEEIILQLELLKLLRGEINLQNVTIQNADISLVKMKNGYSNTTMFKKTADPQKETEKSSSLTASVNKVFLNNVRFSMVDSTKNKWFRIEFRDIEQRFNITTEVVKAKVEGTVYFGGLAFNAEKGSYLTNKTAEVNLLLDFNIAEKKLLIKSSTVEIDKREFLLRGNFAFTDTPHMHLEIDAPSITTQQANTIVTQHIATKLLAFQFENPLLAAIYIDGYLYPGSKPAVDVFFKTENNVLNMKSNSFTDVNALGWFLNHVNEDSINDDHNSKVILTRFHADLGGIPIRSKITITDLIQPHLLMDATVNMALEDIYGIVDTSKFIFNGGTLAVAFKYDGRLVDYIDTVNHLFLGSVKGSVNIRNGDVLYVPRGFQFEKVNTDMTFGDTLLTIHELSLEINKNPVSVTGKVLHFIPFLFVPGQALTAQMQVSAGDLNFDNFTASSSSVKNVQKISASKKRTQQKKINQVIDNILTDMEADVLLNAGKVSYGKFQATNVGGHVILDDDFVRFNEVTMNTSGGTFGLNGSVTSLQRAPYQMAISAAINNADISNLFYSFNNFNQKIITHENLKGQLTSKVTFNASLKNDYSVEAKSMNGRVTILIKNGELLNLEGLDKISQFAFKNRDFSNIQFALLKDTFNLNGHTLTMSRMQIQSSVVTIFAEGTYGFAGGTDMSIQIPLSNLKKRDKNYKPVNVSEDTRLGPSIFLRAREDTDGKIYISYDPLKHYYKDKAGAEQAVVDSLVESLSLDTTMKKKGKRKEKKQE